MESFPDDVPDHVSFQVGYFEGKNSTKRWIVEPRDLQSMYSKANPISFTYPCLKTFHCTNNNGISTFTHFT